MVAEGGEKKTPKIRLEDRSAKRNLRVEAKPMNLIGFRAKRSFGSEALFIIVLLHQYRGKKKSELWKQKQQGSADDEGDQKRENPFVNDSKWHLGYIFNDKDIYCHGGDETPDHDKNMEDDAEPYRIVTKFNHDRKEDRCGKDHECEVIDKRTSYFINQQDENHNEEVGIRKPSDPIGSHHRNLRHDKEMAKDGGPCDEH